MKNSIIFFAPLNTLLEKVKESLEKSGEYSCFVITSPVEYGQVLQLLQTSYTLSSDLNTTQTYASELKKLISSPNHKNIFISENNVSDALKNSLFDEGINEVLKESTSEKIILKNIDIFFKKFSKSKNDVQEPEKKKDNSEIKEVKKDDNSKSVEIDSDKIKKKLQRNKNEVIKVEPLENENDMWLITDKEDCKNVLNRWLIKLVGPSSNYGNWEQSTLKANRDETVWKFVFNQEDLREDFIKTEGSWVFDGAKPEYKWEEKKWVFTGATPTLFFEGNSENYDFRFKFENGAIHLAKNSEFAQNKKEFIERSLEDKRVFEKDAQKDQSSSSLKDNPIENEKTMRGDVAGDSQVGGHLQGDTSSNQEDENQLDGVAFSTEANVGGHMKGALSDDGDVGGHMKGASASDHDVDGDSSGFSSGEGPVDGHMKGANLSDSDVDSHMQGRNSFKEAAKSSSMGGKSEYSENSQSDMQGQTDGTDDLGKDHYSSQESTLHGKNNNGNLSGHTSDSSNLDSGKMAGHNGFQENSHSGQAEGRDGFREDAKEPLAGKTHGDEDHSSSELPNIHGKKKSDEMDGDISNNSEPDKNTMGGKSEYREGAKSPMAGKTYGTEDLGKGHYSSLESTMHGQDYSPGHMPEVTSKDNTESNKNKDSQIDKYNKKPQSLNKDIDSTNDEKKQQAISDDDLSENKNTSKEESSKQSGLIGKKIETIEKEVKDREVGSSKEREQNNDEDESYPQDLDRLQELLEKNSPMKVEMANIKKDKLKELSENDQKTLQIYELDKDVVLETFETFDNKGLYIDIDSLEKDLDVKRVELEEKAKEVVRESYSETIGALPTDNVFEFKSRCLEYITIYEDLFTKKETSQKKKLQYIGFCLNREFNCNLMIFKSRSSNETDLVFNGFELTKDTSSDVDLYIDEIKNMKKYEKTRKISISENKKNKFEYYYPCLDDEGSVSHFSILLGEEKVKGEYCYLDILLDLAGKAVMYEGVK